MRLPCGGSVFSTTAVVALLAACGDAAGPDGEAYALQSFRGAELPAPYALAGDSYATTPFDLTAGTLTLRSGGRLTEVTQIRCRNPLPAGTTECRVANGGRSARDGTYSRDSAWVEFGAGVRFAARFAPGEVTIYYGSGGAAPAVYRR